MEKPVASVTGIVTAFTALKDLLLCDNQVL